MVLFESPQIKMMKRNAPRLSPEHFSWNAMHFTWPAPCQHRNRSCEDLLMRSAIRFWLRQLIALQSSQAMRNVSLLVFRSFTSRLESVLTRQWQMVSQVRFSLCLIFTLRTNHNSSKRTNKTDSCALVCIITDCCVSRQISRNFAPEMRCSTRSPIKNTTENCWTFTEHSAPLLRQ